MARPPPKNLIYKAKINGWESTVTYVPSHRPKGGARVRRRYFRRRQRYFVMHNLKPSYIQVDGKGVARVFNVTTPGRRHKQKFIPKFPPSLVRDLDEYWGSMLAKVSKNDFRYRQYGKHGRHGKCPPGKNYMEEVVRIAKVYIERESKCELMRVMREKGFIPGHVYNCEKFRTAMNVGLKHKVSVSFKSSKSGKKYLHEISTLYHSDFSRWEGAARFREDEEDNCFHLEDFCRNLKKKVHLFDLRTGLRLKHPKLQSPRS